MKRLPTILVVVLLGGVALGVPVAVRRWSARLAASAAEKLDAARQAVVDGDADGAIERYRAYLDTAGPSPDPAALEAYAILLLRRAARPKPPGNEVSAAFDAAEVAVRERPDSVELRRRLGELKLATGKPAEAREHLLLVREALAAGPSTDEAAAVDLLLAKSWAESGDVERAAPIFARLVGFDLAERTFAARGTADGTAPLPPADAEAFLLLANLLRERLRSPAAADVVLERAHEIHPDDVTVLLAYSRMKAAANDLAEAGAAAARAARLAPTDPAAVLADAEMKAMGGDPSAASAAFAAAMERFPENKGIFLAAAEHFKLWGTEGETLELLTEGLSKVADEPRFLSFVAAMQLAPESVARFTQVLEDARKILRVDHPALTLLEARLLLERREWYAAEKLLLRSRAMVPQASKRRIDFMLATCHQWLGDHDLRLARFQPSVKSGATPDFILAAVAAVQLDLGQNDAALDTVRILERLVGESAGSADATAAAEGADLHMTPAQRRQAIRDVLSTIVNVERMQPLAKRDWTAAEKLLSRLESMSWDEPWQLALPRADILASGGDIAAALAVLDPFLVENPSLPELQSRRLAWLAERDGIEGAREAFAGMPQAVRDDPTVLLTLAEAERDAAAGDDRTWIERTGLLADAMADPTAAVRVFQGLAGMASAAGWGYESKTLWQRAAKRKPDDFRPPLALALLAARTGDFDAARAAAAQVAKLDGADTPRSRVALAAALLAEARAGERGTVVTPSVPHRMPAKEAALLRNASQRLVEAANDRPTWQPIAALAGDVALIGNDLTTAIEQFKRARSFGPDNAPLTRDLVTALTKAARYAEASLLEATVAPAGVAGGARTALEAAMRRGDLGAAAARALREIDVERADPETLLWLGRLCGRAGRRGEAGELFLRAVETAPENPDTWLWLARWEVAGGSTEAGEDVIARGIEAVPQEARKLLAARGAITVGRLDDAEREFLAAVASSGDSLAPAGHTVDFYLQQGKPKQAEAFLEKLIGKVAGDISRNDLESWAVRRLDGLRAAAKLPDAGR